MCIDLKIKIMARNKWLGMSIEFSDRMGNIHALDYSRCGSHEEAIGNVRKDIHIKE